MNYPKWFYTLRIIEKPQRSHKVLQRKALMSHFNKGSCLYQRDNEENSMSISSANQSGGNKLYMSGKQANKLNAFEI